jgi:tryptophanase
MGVLHRGQREEAIRSAAYNAFLLSSSDVALDRLKDSGTSTMSTDQWAAYDGARAKATTLGEHMQLLHLWQDTLGHEYIRYSNSTGTCDGLLNTS